MAEDRNRQPDPWSAPLAPLITAEVLRDAASACEPKAQDNGEDGVSPWQQLFNEELRALEREGETGNRAKQRTTT